MIQASSLSSAALFTCLVSLTHTAPLAAGPWGVSEYESRGCEVVVEGFGEGFTSKGETYEMWIEAYLKVQSEAFSPRLEGPIEVIEAGMFVDYRADDSDKEPAWLLGRVVGDEDGSLLFRVRFVTDARREIDGRLMSFRRIVERIAFFVDVLEGTGARSRVWLRNEGVDFNYDEVFLGNSMITFPLENGHISYLLRDGPSPLFDRRNLCLDM